MLSLIQLLMELASLILKPLASRLDIVDTDTEVAKPSVWLHIAIINFKRIIGLGAVIVCQLKNSFPVRPVLAVMQRLRRVIGQKVERKFRIREIKLIDDLQAEEGIEFD